MRKTILSTSDVARLFSVTETTVKRWADDGTLKCQKTPGGHRKFEIRNVVDFAEKNNFDPVGVLAYAGDRRFSEALQVAILGRDYPALVRMYVERALSPDTTDLFAFLSFLYEHRIPLADIYDLVLRPGMHEIGELWANGRIGISHEHRASYETMDALAKLQTEIVVKPPAGKHVLCACLGEELHEIGLRCVSNLFESEGWKVHYLGARTPVDAIAASVQEVRPDVVSLSITSAGSQIANELAAIAGAVQSTGGRMVIGGAGASRALSASGVEATLLQSSGELIGYIGTFSGGVHAAGIPQA
jgi:excisionase family DNA binding protein